MRDVGQPSPKHSRALAHPTAEAPDRQTHANEQEQTHLAIANTLAVSADHCPSP